LHSALSKTNYTKALYIDKKIHNSKILYKSSKT